MTLVSFFNYVIHRLQQCRPELSVQKDQDIYAEDGYADLTYTPQEIVFADMEPLITYSLSFTVESTGDATLQIDKVDIIGFSRRYLYVDTSATEDINLSPGVTREFIVIAQSQEEGASYLERLVYEAMSLRPRTFAFHCAAFLWAMKGH